jgi:hypothetical protein
MIARSCTSIPSNSGCHASWQAAATAAADGGESLQTDFEEDADAEEEEVFAQVERFSFVAETALPSISIASDACFALCSELSVSGCTAVMTVLPLALTELGQDTSIALECSMLELALGDQQSNSAAAAERSGAAAHRQPTCKATVERWAGAKSLLDWSRVRRSEQQIRSMKYEQIMCKFYGFNVI